MRNSLALKALECLVVLGVVPISSIALIEDDFEVDSSSSYAIVNDGTSDGTVSFAYDYVAAGIPLAPRSAAGDRSGLRMTANDTLGQTDAVTVFHNTSIVASSAFRLQVDVYLGVTGTGGTTEHAHIGVGGDGTTFNQLFTPSSGSGHFFAFDGDGGSTSDFRHFKPGVGAVNAGDLSYLDPAHMTNNTGALYQSLFPNGMPRNLWTTLIIEIAGGQITYSLDGTPIIRDTAVVTDGYVSLGYADLFASIATPFQSQFVVYDNLNVAPEPASLLLLGLVLLAMLRRRRAA